MVMTGLEGILGGTPTLVGLAIATFVLIVFAEYGNIRKRAKKGFGLLAAGGLMFFLASTISLPVLQMQSLQTGTGYIGALFQIVGWIFVIVGTVWASIDLAKSE